MLDDQDEARLIGYILGRDQQLQAVELLQFLEQCLPQYMIPSAMLLVDEMPLLTNGKVDRQQLLNMPVPNHMEREAVVAPQTKHQKVLVHIWREVLGLDHVSIRANFFKIGGHSLLANRMTSRVRACTSFALTLKSVFQNPTIEALAKWMDEQTSSPPTLE